MKLSRAFGAASWISAGALALMFAATLFGAPLQERFFPIRGAQLIKVSERTSHRLCYDWTFIKLQDTASDNLDAFLDINGVPSGVVAPYDRDTGLPWGIPRFAVKRRLEPYSYTYCIDLPPAVKASDTLHIRQTAFYPGWMGLWRLSVPFPEIVSVGAASN